VSQENAIALIQDGGKVWTTSLDVAEKFGKQHAHVLRSIRDLECSAQFNQSNFGAVDYVDPKGERRPMVRMTRDGFTFLAMGFTGKEAAIWKERFIAAFNALEQHAFALIEDERAFRRRLEERQQALSEQLASNVLLLGGSVHEVKADVIDIKTRLTVLESQRSARKEVKTATKARHLEVMRSRGNRCPMCDRVAVRIETDHFWQNQIADFEHTWPLCHECHADLTHQRVKRDDVTDLFTAYHKHVDRHMPVQRKLW
jgi:Rha family phage regulatory protein